MWRPNPWKPMSVPVVIIRVVCSSGCLFLLCSPAELGAFHEGKSREKPGEALRSGTRSPCPLLRSHPVGTEPAEPQEGLLEPQGTNPPNALSRFSSGWRWLVAWEPLAAGKRPARARWAEVREALPAPTAWVPCGAGGCSPLRRGRGSRKVGCRGYHSLSLQAEGSAFKNSGFSGDTPQTEGRQPREKLPRPEI